MMKVCVAGYKGAGFGGGFIKWFTFGGFSHVSLVFFPAGEAAPVEIESIQGKGVHRKPFKLDPKTMQLFRVPLSSKQALKAYDTARALIGCKYDWAGIYGFLRRKKRENPAKWFCSELVAHVLHEAGLTLSRLPAWKLSPVMVCASIALEEGEK